MRYLLFIILPILNIISIGSISSQNATQGVFFKTIENNSHITKGVLISRSSNLLDCPTVRLQLEYTLQENKGNGHYDGQFILKWIRKPDTDINCSFRATDFLPFCLSLRVANPADSSQSYTFVIQDDEFVLPAMSNQFSFQFQFRHKHWPEGIRVLDFQVFSEQQKYLERFRFQHPLFSAIFYAEAPLVSNYRDNMDLICTSLTSGTYLDLEKGLNSIYTKKLTFSPRIAIFRSGEKDLNEFIKKHNTVALYHNIPLLDGQEYITEDWIWKGKKSRDIYTTLDPGRGSRQILFHRFVDLGKGNFMIIQMPYRRISDTVLLPDKKKGLEIIKREMGITSHFFDSFQFK